VTALACPMPSCSFTEPLSVEDPDCTLSIVHNHLRGYPHYLSRAEALEKLAQVREVPA